MLFFLFRKQLCSTPLTTYPRGNKKQQQHGKELFFRRQQPNNGWKKVRPPTAHSSSPSIPPLPPYARGESFHETNLGTEGRRRRPVSPSPPLTATQHILCPFIPRPQTKQNKLGPLFPHVASESCFPMVPSLGLYLLVCGAPVGPEGRDDTRETGAADPG